MRKNLLLIVYCLFIFAATASAQSGTDVKQTTTPVEKKSNQRPAAAAPSEPFDKADVKTMESQCVKLNTEAGVIDLEMFPATAPETVRNFLNLVAIGAFDTTIFSRIVPGFVIQGGNLATRQTLTSELVKRARRTIMDEPNLVKHERGIVSMARPEEPNGASTHFFILVSTAPSLDGKFAAFGRVTNGMDIVDAISKMNVEGDKPTKPVRLTKASLYTCPVRADN